MEYFKFLPEEVRLDILTRLPTESVLDCKLVCKTWNNVARHPSFNIMHLYRLNHSTDGKLGFISKDENERLHYFEYDGNLELTPIRKIRSFNFTVPFTYSRILDSCNGLICLVEDDHLSVCICNPITKEHVILPLIKTNYCDIGDVHRRYGFGYVSSTKEYKVVGIYMHKKTKLLQIHIYTLGSDNGWRNLGDLNPEFGMYYWDQAIFANGALYWMSSKLKMIVTFDLAKEKFSDHISPPSLPSIPYLDTWTSNKIGVVDGFLYFAAYIFVQRTECYDIWLLRKKNENHDMKEQQEHQPSVWSKEFRVHDSRILAVTESGGVLCYSNNNFMPNLLCIYNLIGSTTKWVVDIRMQVLQVLPHMNTLVSLKELGEEDSKTMESVKVGNRRSHFQPLKKLLDDIPAYTLINW